MSIDKQTLEDVANLARIELTPEELKRLSGQLKSILDFIDKLKELDTQNVTPTSHILPINNILREDVQKESLPPEKALENAPQKESNFFGVPKVIE